jgi:hypothetical protein
VIAEARNTAGIGVNRALVKIWGNKANRYLANISLGMEFRFSSCGRGDSFACVRGLFREFSSECKPNPVSGNGPRIGRSSCCRLIILFPQSNPAGSLAGYGVKKLAGGTRRWELAWPYGLPLPIGRYRGKPKQTAFSFDDADSFAMALCLIIQVLLKYVP